MPGVGVAGGHDVCRWLAQGVANTLIIGVGKDGSIPPLYYEAGVTQPGDIDRYHPLVCGIGCYSLNLFSSAHPDGNAIAARATLNKSPGMNGYSPALRTEFAGT